MEAVADAAERKESNQAAARLEDGRDEVSDARSSQSGNSSASLRYACSR